MRYLGWAIFVLGILLIIVGWSLDAGTETIFSGLSSQRLVNIHHLFIKLSYILVGGFCLCSGSIFACMPPSTQKYASPQPEFRHRDHLVYKTAAGQFTVSGRDFQTADDARTWLDAKMVSRPIPKPERWFMHNDQKVEMNDDGSALVDGQVFPSTDAAKEYLDTKYPPPAQS